MEKLETRPKAEPGAEPKAKPRSKGPVYLAVPRQLSEYLVSKGESAEASVTARNKDDAMMAMAKLAAMGISSDFAWSDDTNSWYSEIQIPAAVFHGLIGDCKLVKSIDLIPGELTVDKYLTKF